jgi:hypothetical protein
MFYGPFTVIISSLHTLSPGNNPHLHICYTQKPILASLFETSLPGDWCL